MSAVDPAPSVCLSTGEPGATRAVAHALSNILGDGDLLVMTGDLGAGKTCFTQGLGRGLGIDDPITSPTFTIASRYEGRVVLNHLDVYRIEQLDDTLDLDLPELLETGITVIEWGEQIAPALPDEHLLIRLEYGDGDDDRVICFEPRGERWASRLSAIREAVAGRGQPC